MRTSLCAVLFLLSLHGAVPPAQRFGGIWVATFKGVDICTLEIKDDGEKIEGASKDCKVSVDQNGDLIEGEKPDGSGEPEPFLSPKVDGTVLRYQQDEDGTPMKFELHLMGEGKADLHFIGAPITIKPIKFERRP
ncbi:MAG TPA: hypothetical protein VGL53_23080 [Bryobacteraceae bacterium]|jgi:hypothetical protein